jgi:hypothetical protein
VPSEELFWRIHFSLGAAMFSLSGFEILSAFSPGNERGEAASVITVHKYIIPFLIAGLTAESQG